MKKYAIFGNPVAHSKSPKIFNTLFSEYGQDNLYKCIRVSEAKEIINIFDRYDLSGANITSPFKEIILQYLDKVDHIASQVNAVNTVIRKGNHLYGFNTDVYGVENAIIKNGLNVKNKKCIVIGAGGAAKASVYALKSLGANIYSTNRTDSKSHAIAQIFDCAHLLFDEIQNSIKDAYLIVIAVKKIEIDLSNAAKDAVILDANYHLDQPFGRYLRHIDGHDWLIYQAAKSYEIFFDRIPDNITLKTTLKNEKSRSKKIALIGMPGVGKTFYGKIISAKLNKTFFDTDAIIEEKYGLAIDEIFEKYGEKKFRKYEEDTVRGLCKNDNCLVSIGGGAIESVEIRDILKRDYYVIYLHADPENLIKSLKSEQKEISIRPLLSKGKIDKNINKLFKIRKNYYFSSCNLIIALQLESYDKNISVLYDELFNFSN